MNRTEASFENEFKKRTAILYFMVLFFEAIFIFLEKLAHLNGDFSFVFLIVALIIVTIYGILVTRYRGELTANVCFVLAMFFSFTLSYPLFIVDWQRVKSTGWKGLEDLMLETREMW